jgi:hypothetical protein
MLADSLHSLLRRLDAFERWFDQRFGWFFTNGMKPPRGPRPGGVKA